MSSTPAYKKAVSVPQTATADTTLSNAGSIIACAVVADGFTLSQTDHAGVTTTATRTYTATGIVPEQTDGRSNTTVATRSYAYDSLGRPSTRSTAKDGITHNDVFHYTKRSELVNANLNGVQHGYDYDNIRGTLYLTDKEKKRDIISKLRKKPQGISKAEYLTSLDLPSNSFTLKPSGDTYKGIKHHEMVHKKQILMHKKEIQRIMDSYKTLICFNKNATNKQIEDECKSRPADIYWKFAHEHGIKNDILEKNHLIYEREAIKKTYDFYIKKYSL